MSDQYWDVRVPLVHGSRQYARLANEAQAREYAEDLSVKKYGNNGLQIHTKSRTIYINAEEN